MRILTRYILREVTSHALLGGALFTFIIFTRDLGKILEFVVRDSATYADVVRIIAYTLPNALVVTIDTPVSGIRERDYRNGMKELISGGPFEKIPFLPQILSRPGWLMARGCRCWLAFRPPRSDW